MRAGLLALLPFVVGCGARVDPLQTQRAELRRLATAPVERSTPAHLSAVVSSEVLGELLFAVLRNGQDGSGRFVIDTPLGPASLTVDPQAFREPIALTPARCDGCVRVSGTVTGQVQAAVGQLDVNARAGAHAQLSLQISARTDGAATLIEITPRWDNNTQVELQLLGLPMGGLGINEQLKRGVREALDGQTFTVARLPAAGALPLRGVSVGGRGQVSASLRVRGATEAPAGPRQLDEGVWVGLSTPTLLGWIEGYALRQSSRRWSVLPTTLDIADGQVSAEVEVWRHKRKPKRRTYRVQTAVGQVGETWVLAEPDVERLDRKGVDPVGGAIRGTIRKQVRELLAEDLLAGGDIHLGSEVLHWSIDDLRAEPESLQLWLDLAPAEAAPGTMRR